MAIPTKTTSTTGQWAFNLSLNGAFMAMFYLWQARDIDGAGNLYIFAAWTLAVLGLLVGVLCCYAPQYTETKTTWPEWSKFLDRTRTAGMILSGAWLGHYMLACSLLAAVLLLAAARAKLAESQVAP